MPSQERWLLARCVAVVAATRLALWIAPYRVVRDATDRLSRPVSGRRLPPGEADRIAANVERAGRVIRDASCLTQALAARVLMRRNGLDARLRLGVRRGRSGSMEAHAWIESDGRVVVGAGEIGSFAPLRGPVRDRD